MALAHFQRTFTDAAGNIKPGLAVTVRRESDNGLAALFADAGSVTAKSNPFNTDANGYGSFYVVDGRYRIQATDIDWRNEDLVSQPDLAASIATNTAAILDRVIRVTSISAMAAYSAPVGYVFSLNAGGRSGVFDVVAGDFSAELAADTLNGIYVGLADNATATTKVAQRRISDSINPMWFGAKGDWDGATGTDDTTAIQAAMNFLDFGFLDIPDDRTFRSTGVLGKFGVKIRGGGRFYYEPNDAIVNAESEKSSVKKYMHTWEIRNVEEMLQIKGLGFNTFIHYAQYYTGGSTQQTMDSTFCVDMDIVLYHRTGSSDTPEVEFDDRKNLIGYVLFDEPSQHSTLAAAQDTRISAYRAETNKDLYVADNSNYFIGETGVWSTNWDVFLIDIYAVDTDSYEQTKASGVQVWIQIKEAAGRAKIVPVLGLFTYPGEFTDKAKQIEWGKQLFHISEDGSFGVFGWNPSVVDQTFTDVSTDADFRKVASDLTTKQSNYYKYEVIQCLTDSKSLTSFVNTYNENYAVNMLPYSVKNVGSQVDARNSSFTGRGIGVSNEGGIFPTRLITKDYLVYRHIYRNFFNTSNLTVSLKTYLDDFLQVQQSLTSTVLENTESTSGAVYTNPGFGLAIEAVTEDSTGLYWKFLLGYIATTNWKD